MGQKTGRPRGRPKGSTNGALDLHGTPGSKEFGDAAREQLAAALLKELPLKERATLLVELVRNGQATSGKEDKQADPASMSPFAAYGAAIGARLTALKYINELSGVVTVAQEKEAESTVSLPQIIIEGEPPPRPGSAEALRLLATAKGSQYDEAFPSSPPAPPEPPKPFQSVVTVRES